MPGAFLILWKFAPRTEDLHVVRPLERRRFLDVLLAHTALHLGNGFVFVVLHP